MERTVPKPYIDPNFSEPPEWTVNVQLIPWSELPPVQKEMMILEKLRNARTTEEVNLAYKLRDIENKLHSKKQNDQGDNTGNQGVRQQTRSGRDT
jgi:hypothetical protein